MTLWDRMIWHQRQKETANSVVNFFSLNFSCFLTNLFIQQTIRVILKLHLYPVIPLAHFPMVCFPETGSPCGPGRSAYSLSSTVWPQPPRILRVTSLILKLNFENIYIIIVYKLLVLLMLGSSPPLPSTCLINSFSFRSVLFCQMSPVHFIV